MRITGLPATCSAFYLSELAGVTTEQVRKAITDHMALDHKKNGLMGVAGKHTCAYFASVVRPDAIRALQGAGFIKVSGYYSHRHRREVTYMMMRPTSKMEWQDGTARFPTRRKKAS